MSGPAFSVAVRAAAVHPCLESQLTITIFAFDFKLRLLVTAKHRVRLIRVLSSAIREILHSAYTSVQALRQIKMPPRRPRLRALQNNFIGPLSRCPDLQFLRFVSEAGLLMFDIIKFFLDKFFHRRINFDQILRITLRL